MFSLKLIGNITIFLSYNHKKKKKKIHQCDYQAI